MYFIEHTPQGRIVAASSCQDEAFDLQVKRASENTLLEIDSNLQYAIDACYVGAGGILTIPDQPSAAHTFNWDTKQWDSPPDPTLDQLKDDKWTAIKRQRSLAESGGFTWDASIFDSDSISQSRISGAVTLAMLSPAFVIDWTLADNTVRTLTAADMIAVGVALGGHVAAQHEKARGLRVQIGGATDQAGVLAVVWSVSP